MSDINDIIGGISIKLDSFFNKEEKNKYVIYGEEIKQGLTEPCFFIKVLNPRIKQIVGSRYLKMQSFDIHYFPESTIEPEKEMLSVAENLYEALEYINCNNDMFRGTSMNYEITDDVLHFLVDYNYYCIREQEKVDYVEDLQVIGGVKNEEI